MSDSAKSPRLVIAVCCTIVAGVILFALLAVHHDNLLVTQGYEIDGTPLVTNNDGYYYLDRARQFVLEENSLVDVMPTSGDSLLLSKGLAAISGYFGKDVLTIAVYVGPVLGLTMLFALMPWGLDIRSPFVLFTAPLLSLLAPFWLERTHVGVLDTDTLVPFLTYLALYCVMKFSVGTEQRWVWPSFLSLIIVILWFWWKPGAFISAGFIACYLIYWPRQNGDLVIKLLLIAAVASAAGLAVLGIQPFAQYGSYLSAHALLAFGSISNSLLSSAIIELKRLTLTELGEQTLGSVWLLPTVVAGAFLYVWKYRWQGLFLVSTCLFGVAALLSQRFVPLFIPTAAFFACFFVNSACGWGVGRLAPCFKLNVQRARLVVFAVSMPLLFLPTISNCISYEPRPYFSRSDYELALTIKEEFPVKTIVWTWWDYGYFYKYFTEMDTFFDGGSQTDMSCFIAAYPLMQKDTGRAVRWMRHFSSTPVRRLDLSKRGGQWAGYVADYVNRLPENNEPIRPVALCLPARVFTTVGYLYSFAHVFNKTVPPVVNRLEIFNKKGFQYEPDSGVVVVPEEVIARGYDSFGSVLDTTGMVPSQFDFNVLPGPYLVFSDKADFLAIADKTSIDSVLFRLLGLFEADTNHFEPVRFDYRTGGVWRVR